MRVVTGEPDASFTDTCTPSTFAGDIPTTYGENVYDLSVPEDESFALVTVDGTVMVRDPVESPQVSVTGFDAGTAYSHIALVPSGKAAFIAFSQLNQIAIAGLSPTQWGMAKANGLPDGYPGVPSAVSRIVVERTGPNRFEEYMHNGGTSWNFQHALVPTQLGHVATDTISYPSLTADGLVLVYVQRGVAGNGVWFRKRPDLSTSFAAATAIGGLLLSGVYRSPTLTTKCRHLWVVAAGGGNAGQARVYAH